jgi:hypothetical protein
MIKRKRTPKREAMADNTLHYILSNMKPLPTHTLKEKENKTMVNKVVRKSRQFLLH